MARQVLFLGTNPNDHTGETLRGGGGMINENFEELYALQSDTINAGALAYSAATNHARIQLAINDAVLLGKSRVFSPGQYLPYDASQVTFNSSVQMTREGGEWSLYDVYAYGAAGDGVQDDTVAIQAAVTAASVNSGAALKGGVVYFPGGKYIITAPIVIPVAVNENQVTLTGVNMRVTYLFPSGAASNFASGVIRFGASTPDASGTSDNQTFYCGMENMSIRGSLLTGGGDAVAVQFVEMQKGWMQNVVIESFPNASIGLYLLGSTTTGGVGAAAAPHVWRCGFWNVLVTTITRPLVIQNADENDFYNCNFQVQTGLTAAADSLFAAEFRQGRNNRFYGCLLSGDTTALKTAYVGAYFRAPVNAAGAANGDVLNNRFYGAVLEGFDRTMWQASAGPAGNGGSGLNPSIYTTAFLDSGGAGSRFLYESYIANLHYHATRIPYGPVGTLVLSTGTNSPSVASGNVWACSGAAGSIIIAFADAEPGQPFWVRLDANTTVRDSNSGGTDIRCWGRQDIAAGSEKWVSFVRIAGITYQMAPPVTNLLTGSGGIFDIPVPASMKQYLEGVEISDPVAPVANRGRLYFKDNGAGKTQCVVLFPTGAVQVLATEP